MHMKSRQNRNDYGSLVFAPILSCSYLKHILLTSLYTWIFLLVSFFSTAFPESQSWPGSSQLLMVIQNIMMGLPCVKHSYEAMMR